MRKSDQRNVRRIAFTPKRNASLLLLFLSPFFFLVFPFFFFLFFLLSPLLGRGAKHANERRNISTAGQMRAVIFFGIFRAE